MQFPKLVEGPSFYLKLINGFYAFLIIVAVAVEVEVDARSVWFSEVTLADIQAFVGIYFFHIHGPNGQCRV